MVESGVDARASDTRASGGDCVGRFQSFLVHGLLRKLDTSRL